MKVLGIDPGYGLCGFAIIEKIDGDLHLRDYGVIRTAPGTEFSHRLTEIADDFQSLLTRHKPDKVAIEDLFFVQNITTGLQVAEVRGVLTYLATRAGCPVIAPKPVEVKSTFTGNGKASKTEMKKMAKLHFQLEKAPKIDDAADAIAVAYFAVQHQF